MTAFAAHLAAVLREMGFQIDGDRVWTLTIPEAYRAYFRGEDTLYVPVHDLPSSPYLPLLLSLYERTCPVPRSVVPGDGSLYAVYKISIRNHLVEEVINVYRIDPFGTLSSCDLDEVKALLGQGDVSASSPSVDEERLRSAAEEGARLLIREKQALTRPSLQAEIERIQSYYELVKREHLSSYTELSYADYEVMKTERDHLIQRQFDKYRYDWDDVITTPIAYVFTSPPEKRREM